MSDLGAPLIKTENLVKSFGGVKAVDDVNFTLAEKELRCLIGPNGAGKSSFFRCLTKIYQPTSGKLFLRGKDVTSAETHEITRSGVGIKTQVPSVFDGLTVSENLELAAITRYSRAEAVRIVDETSERFKLGAIRSKRLDRLSHGQRQWVELAVVVTSKPTLILLDEPTAGMTHSEVEQTAQLILDLNREAAIVVVEHDMQFIRSIAKRVTVFHRGKIFLEDDVDQVLKDERVGEIYLGKRKPRS
jgi:branched-chain amino acid transport system ATP-binding protein